MNLHAKILVVNDERMIVMAMRRALETAGYETLAANNGEEALELIHSFKPDLVLLDVNMPGLNGFEVCRQIKAAPSLSGIYVILLSNVSTDTDSQAQGLEIGADGYLAMPMANRELIARIQALLRIQAAERALRQSEGRFRTLYDTLNAILESANTPIFSLDQQFCYTSFNNAHAAVMKALYGAEIEIGKNMPQYMTVEIDRQTAQKNLGQALQGEYVVQADYSGEEERTRRYYEVSHNPIRTNSGEIIGVSVFALDVTGHKQAEIVLHKQAERMCSLYEIDQAIMSAQSPQNIAQITLRTIGQFVPCQCASIILFDERSRQGLVFSLNTEQQGPIQTSTCPEPSAELKAKLAAGHEVYIEDITEGAAPYPPALVGILQEGVIRSFLDIPLMAYGEVVGLLNLASTQPRAFQQDHISTAIEMSLQVAVAIRQARLYQQIQQYAGELERHVEARTAELHRANQELARASRLKDEFLASMSHELRTPLTGIINLSEALKEQVYGELNEKQHQTLLTIEDSGRHLLGLINDILDVTKIEAGQIRLQIGWCSAHDACHSSLQMVRGLAQKKNQHIFYTVHPEFLEFKADPRRIKQMLVNLLSNAIKFTPEGGEIGLEAVENAQEKQVTFTVRDNGIGIALRICPSFLPSSPNSTAASRANNLAPAWGCFWSSAWLSCTADGSA